MATTKKATTTKIKMTKGMVITLYMNHVLENGKRPASVFKFSKDHNFEEAEFYSFFGSFEGLREQIWVTFYENTVKVLHSNQDYEHYTNKNKLLAFFYTFFELLTANRSYVLFTLNEHQGTFKNLGQLKKLRLKVREFSSDLIEESNEQKSFKLAKNPVTIFSEGAWLQFLFLLKYWKDDDSAGFEKTDVAIEKSVNAIFDVFETSALESVFDFGKFLFKENF